MSEVRVGDIVDVASMARYLERAIGVVTAIDDRGVHVTFDHDIYGLRTCYATHHELTRLPDGADLD